MAKRGINTDIWTDRNRVSEQGDPNTGLGQRTKADARSACDSDVSEEYAGQKGLAAEKHSAGYVWYVIFLLSLVNVFNYMDRMALAVLVPPIKAELQISDTEVGFLIGFAFSVFYAVCGLPIARWADLSSRRNIIAMALAVWSAMTALSGAAQNFWHLFAARVGIGAGEAGCNPAAQSILCDYVPLKRRPGVFAIHSFGLMLGMMLGMALAGSLGETIGWRWTFVVLGAPGIALAVVVRVTLREPIRGALDVLKDYDRGSSFRETIDVLARCRTFRLLVLFYVVNGFVQYGSNQWWPSFYARIFGLSLSSVGVYLGTAIGVGSGVGLLIGGLFSNRAAQRDIRFSLMIGAIATLLGLPAACGALFAPTASSSILLISLASMFWAVSYGAVVATAMSVVRPRMRAMAGAITVFSTSVLGFGLGPLCVGWLSDMLVPSLGLEALRYALLVPTALVPVMAMTLYEAAKQLPVDLSSLGAQVENVSAAATNKH